MAYIEKEIGEKLIERMYKSVKTSIKSLDKLIEKYREDNPSYLRGLKEGQITLKLDIKVIRYLI